MYMEATCSVGRVSDTGLFFQALSVLDVLSLPSTVKHVYYTCIHTNEKAMQIHVYMYSMCTSLYVYIPK